MLFNPQVGGYIERSKYVSFLESINKALGAVKFDVAEFTKKTFDVGVFSRAVELGIQEYEE
jgi:hypothetical protein